MKRIAITVDEVSIAGLIDYYNHCIEEAGEELDTAELEQVQQTLAEIEQAYDHLCNQTGE